MTNYRTDGDDEVRQLFRDVAAEMEEWLDGDSSGHDADHAWRVFDLATRIADEEGADEEVVGAAALTHDVHRAMGGTESVHPEESLPEVRTVLERTGFPEPKIPAVLHCVEVHDEYDYRGVERPAESIEAEILRDADNLDAIGAVGIARNFAFTGVYGNPLWDPDGGAREQGERESRRSSSDGEKPSGIGHCYDKLLKLKDEMHTETARQLAEERHAFLEAFVERFEREWYGET